MSERRDQKINPRTSARINRIIDSWRVRKRNKPSRCWPHAVKRYMSANERESVIRLFRQYGIKYTKEKRRLRVAYKIPWGVDFDIHNPATCSKAGTWDGATEILMDVLNHEHEARGGHVRLQSGNDPTCKHEETGPWEKSQFGFVPTYVANCSKCGEFLFRFPPKEEVSPEQMEKAFKATEEYIGGLAQGR